MPARPDSHLLLRAFADELVRCGVTDAVTSPGSRSTPVVLALAREPGLRAHSHVDERAAAFFALGLAKASRRPVVLACTSGTAAAEYLPAVIEAHEAGVPLIVLTADRPPELRDSGAGQTIDQVKLYGAAVRWYVDLGIHEATAATVRWARALACRVVWTTEGAAGRPGPVQVDVPLREPLVVAPPLPADPQPGRAGGAPWLARPAAAPASSAGTLSAAVIDHERVLVVAGRGERDPHLADVVEAFADAAGAPLLADTLSGARRSPNAIAHYDALLRDPSWERVPDLVLRVGDLPTSKPLRQWLAGLDALQVAFDPENAWQDPSGVVATIVGADPRTTLETLTGKLPRKRKDTAWLDGWHEADRAASRAIASVVGPAGLNEPRVAAELGTLLPTEATLVVASSMPIRDVETFFPAREAPFRVLSNRGANGIDGTVSTAFGVTAAGRGPTVLLIGDVALAHDVGGLLAASRLGLKLVIVLIDNDGGGIFEFLPAAREGAEYVEHIATPHGLDFAHAAELYGVGYERAADVEGFRAALERAIAAERTTIVCVRTHRESNVELHRRVWESVRAAT
jgi:2-succinyl-5-enolpyruvyl-6-hydroxy-3-cyclohexene-1-carboxylate synthase